MESPLKGPSAGAHVLRSAALALAGLAVVALAYRRPFTYRIDVGADDAPYVDGFEGREREEGVDWRWSAGESRLIFHNAGQLVRNPRLRLRLTSHQPPRALAPQVSVALGESVVATFEAPRALAVRGFDFDTRGLGFGDWILSISSQTVERRDGRRLGVFVDWAELVSSADATLPPWRTAVLFVLAAVSFYTLMVLHGAGRLAWYGCLAGEVLGSGALIRAREASVELLPFIAGALAAVAAVSLVRSSGVAARFGRLQAAHVQASFALGLMLLFGGQVLLSAGGSRTAGLALLALGVAFALKPQRWRAESRSPVARLEWIALGGITALALALRVYRLGEVPFAIFRDEARHGSIALGILATHSLPPLFLGPPINQPAPYFVALAALFQLLGPGLVSLRLVSSLAGAAAVPLAWRLARDIAGPRVALVAAFALAVSSWHVSISRFAVNYVEPTLFTLPAYLFLLKGLRSGRVRDFVLSGLLAGTAQYASHTAKAALVVLAAMIVDEAVLQLRARRWAALRRILANAVVAAGVGLLVVAPLLREIWRTPEAYAARMRQVLIWNDANATGEYRLMALASNVRAYLGAFNVEGDPNGRHHLPGQPLLDPVSGACFVAGMILLASRLRESRHRFLLYWLAGSILPGLLSVNAPSATRIVEAAAAVGAIVAIGAVALFERARAHVSTGALRAALAVLAATALSHNAWVYFGAMYRSPEVWGKFAPVGTQLGQRLRVLEATGRIAEGAILHAPEAFVRHPDEVHVLRFFMPRLEVESFQGEGAVARAGDLIVIPNYPDLWRHVAAATPRYAPRAEQAAAELVEWRQWLDSIPHSAAEEGPPFPATHDPTYWLYVVSGVGRRNPP